MNSWNGTNLNFPQNQFDIEIFRIFSWSIDKRHVPNVPNVVKSKQNNRNKNW